MPTLLISGASGMLGSAIAGAFLKKDWHVIAIRHTHPLPLKHERLSILTLDLRSLSDIESIPTAGPIDLAIHCAAMKDIETCEQHLELAFQSNALATYHFTCLAKRFGEKATRFVYVSTDAVYPDADQPKSELLSVAPLSNYGLTKLWGEQIAIKEFEERALVLRTTIVGFGKGQFCDWIVKTAQEKKKLTLFSDVLFTPISTLSFADSLYRAWERRLFGIYNIGSSHPLSKADFAEKLLSRLKIPYTRDLVSISSFPYQKTRSRNMALDCSKLLKALGGTPYTPEECVADLVSIYNNH